MRFAVAAFILYSLPAAALAQTAPAPVAPAPAAPAVDTAAPATPAPAATPDVLNADTPIGAILADAAGKEVIEKDMPTLLKHPQLEQIKGMSLRQVQPYSGGTITDDLIKKVEADLAKARKVG